MWFWGVGVDLHATLGSELESSPLHGCLDLLTSWETSGRYNHIVVV